jgi:hypothetical protein
LFPRGGEGGAAGSAAAAAVAAVGGACPPLCEGGLSEDEGGRATSRRDEEPANACAMEAASGEGEEYRE